MHLNLYFIAPPPPTSKALRVRGGPSSQKMRAREEISAFSGICVRPKENLETRLIVLTTPADLEEARAPPFDGAVFDGRLVRVHDHAHAAALTSLELELADAPWPATNVASACWHVLRWLRHSARPAHSDAVSVMQ